MRYSLAISRGDQIVQVLPYSEKTFSIGRLPSNDIVLDGEKVEPRHARLVCQTDAVLVFNLTEGKGDVFRNGSAINSSVIGFQDEIGIAEFKIHFVLDKNADALSKSEAKNRLHQELIVKMDLRKMKLEQLQSEDLRNRCEVVLQDLIRAKPLPEGLDPVLIKNEVLDEALGLGPLEKLLADDSVTEIMVNNKDHIFVERNGRLQLTDLSVTSNENLINIIQRIVTPLGRRIDESIPMVDARLADGSRVNAIIPPLSLKGPMITIRKFGKKIFTPADYVRFGSGTLEMFDFLEKCVLARKNLVISGGTGSGKTSLLNCLSSYIPKGERVLTIEDSAELKLPHENLGSLEARPANIEGKGAVTIRDLVRNALRMRPDRIVVGECRGGESLDMLQAMNTGHDGSLTTLHANSPDDAILRLETMVMMAGFDLPSAVIRQQIASAVHLIVQQARFADGSRRITEVSEVIGMEGTNVKMKPIFRFIRTGLDESGKYLGHFEATGEKPTFLDEFAGMGIQIDSTLFTAQRPLQ